MDALTASLDKIRARSHTPVEPIADRLVYASFPDHLKAAMKIAAANYGWDRATWAMQTQMIQDALLSGRDTDDNIAARYGAPKQPCPWGEPGDLL